MVGASAYDAFMVIINGIKVAGELDTQKIRDAIAASELEGLTGVSKFTEQGEVIKPMVVQIVKDWGFHYLDTVDDPAVLEK